MILVAAALDRSVSHNVSHIRSCADRMSSEPGGISGDAGECDQLPSLTEWATAIAGYQGFALAAHHRLLLRELEAISSGDNDRLIVLMPPGSAKSSYASIVFPAWWLLRHPATSVIAASHTASLARYFGRQVRELVETEGERLGLGLKAGARSAGEWRTTNGGEYFCAGIRGPIMGRRADLTIVDDPIKSQAEADSAKIREHLWNWYRQDLTSRLKPKGRMVLIMTRWHEDDLAGRLLTQTSRSWRCLCLPALAREGDALGRAPGTALWPEWEDQAALECKRLEVGERAWSAMYQQSPSSANGRVFRVGKMPVLDTAPVAKQAVRAWDLAATAADEGTNPDWTVGLKMLRDDNGQFVVQDVVRLQGTSGQVDDVLVETARIDGPEVTIALPEDPGQAGKSQVNYMTKMLAGYTIRSSRETGSKEVRASPVASQIERGHISIVRAAWNYAFLDELREFPFGSKDDQVDALSRAFHNLIDLPAPVRRAAVMFMMR